MNVQIKDIPYEHGRKPEWLPLLPSVLEKQFGWLAFSPSPSQKEIFQQYGISLEMARTFRDTIAKGASVEELIIFCGVAKKYGLDPFTGEIYFIKYAKKREIVIDGKRFHFYDYQNVVGTIVVGYKGYMNHARKQKDFCGYPGDLICSNDVFELRWSVDDRGLPKVVGLKHEYSAKDRGNILGAWRCVIRKISETIFAPEYYIGYLEEHGKKYQDGALVWKSDIWEKDTATMLTKCVISNALRIAYGMTDTTPEEDIVKPETIGDSRADEYPESRKDRDIARMNTAGSLEELQSIAEELNGWVMTSELRAEFGKCYQEKARYFKALPDKTGAIVMETHSTKKPEPELVKTVEKRESNPEPETVSERSVEPQEIESNTEPEKESAEPFTAEELAKICHVDLRESRPDNVKRFIVELESQSIVDTMNRQRFMVHADGTFTTKGIPGRKPTEAIEKPAQEPEATKESAKPAEPKQQTSVGPDKSKTSIFRMLAEEAEKLDPGCVSRIYEDFGIGNMTDMDNDMLDAGIELLKDSIGKGA
jgi:hypothetical protein